MHLQCATGAGETDTCGQKLTVTESAGFSVSSVCAMLDGFIAAWITRLSLICLVYLEEKKWC
jgi:hypothetical protein